MCLKEGLSKYNHIKFQSKMIRIRTLVIFPISDIQLALRQDWCPKIRFHEVIVTSLVSKIEPVF